MVRGAHGQPHLPRPTRTRTRRQARPSHHRRLGTDLRKTALDIAKEVTDWPLAAIVYTDIATDGTLQGPNIDATRQIAQATHVPVVASGGVGTLDDLVALRKLPIQGAIVGKAFYEDKFTIKEAIEAFEH